jgi:hypothetical protein
LIFTPAAGKQEYPFRAAGFRAIYVYDVSQTDGKPLPESPHTANVDVWKYGEQLKELVAKRGIDLQVDRSIEPARGVSSGGKIRLSPGLSPAEWVSVLTHELTYEALHHRPEAAALSRDVIEAQAYGVAYVVGRGLGIATHTAAAEYMGQYAGDKRALAQMLAAIQETSAQILDELLPEARAAAGGAPALDEKGFTQIHREYGDRLIRSVTGFVRDRDKAEDIAARAFQTAWEKRERFRGESKASSWIEAIARNEAAILSPGADRPIRFDRHGGSPGTRSTGAGDRWVGKTRRPAPTPERSRPASR